MVQAVQLMQGYIDLLLKTQNLESVKFHKNETIVAMIAAPISWITKTCTKTYITRAFNMSPAPTVI